MLALHKREVVALQREQKFFRILSTQRRMNQSSQDVKWHLVRQSGSSLEHTVGQELSQDSLGQVIILLSSRFHLGYLEEFNLFEKGHEVSHRDALKRSHGHDLDILFFFTCVLNGALIAISLSSFEERLPQFREVNQKRLREEFLLRRNKRGVLR